MPNERLAEVMYEAGVSSKALARSVRDLSQGSVSSDHSSVSRWLAGGRPREKTARFIAQALGSKLGRTLSLDDIGMASADTLNPDVGIPYADTAQAAIDSLGLLWRADLDDVQAILTAPTDANAWNEASLGWLVRSGAERFTETASPARVGAADVALVTTTAKLFAALDNRFGGGHARRALVQYLHTDLAAMLEASHTETVGRQLYAAAAEATLLAAWMTYDEGGKHGLAQRYFIQALRLAQAADDTLLAGSVLDAMSHQATFLGRYREAANMARAARAGTKGHATATLTAHFHAMEARALAGSGDAAGMHAALSEAVRVFERRQPGIDPDWISYVDDAELSAEFGHCFRDIGRHADAVTYAERALSGASDRSDFFVTMVLAAGHLGDGHIEEACRVANTALDLGRTLRSGRCVEYVRQFREGLAPHGRHPAVRSLVEQGAGHSLWLASEQSGQ